MARNLYLEYPSMIKKFNDTLHTNFVSHDIYQRDHYLHIRYIYTLPAHLAQAFEQMDNLITCPIHEEDKTI